MSLGHFEKNEKNCVLDFLIQFHFIAVWKYEEFYRSISFHLYSSVPIKSTVWENNSTGCAHCIFHFILWTLSYCNFIQNKLAELKFHFIGKKYLYFQQRVQLEHFLSARYGIKFIIFNIQNGELVVCKIIRILFFNTLRVGHETKVKLSKNWFSIYAYHTFITFCDTF